MYYRHTGKSALRSQNMIADALFELMKRKDFQKITVTEICKEAAVGRKTFYRNFELREDVIDFRLDSVYSEYEKGFYAISAEKRLKYHYEFVCRHMELFITLYKNGLLPLANSKFSVLLPNAMPGWTDDPVEQQYKSAYLISGVEAIERVWIERGLCESVEEIVMFTHKALREGIMRRNADIL